jgi:probable rRNA maturation factor
LGFLEAELSLTLVGDRAMARLNRETFGRRGPTNVIAFPVAFGEQVWEEGQAPKAPPPTPVLGGGPDILAGAPGKSRAKSGPPPVLGEVVISVETTRRQAEEFGWPFEELLDFYLIHGILHLLGLDHQTPAEDAAMEAKTWELLEMLRGE